jgi:hypothetical protein
VSNRSSNSLTFSFAWANLSRGFGATSLTAMAPIALISAISKLLRVIVNLSSRSFTGEQIFDREQSSAMDSPLLLSRRIRDSDFGIFARNTNGYAGNGDALTRDGLVAKYGIGGERRKDKAASP